jgi:CheY-like chemotaxis protein
MTVRPSLQNRRILLVEDEYYIAQDLDRSFKALGAQIVGPVATVEEALFVVDSRTPLDAAVLDINLHGKQIFVVADKLRARGVPFVFATGYGPETIPERFAGVVRCEKPVDPAKIAHALFVAVAA